MKTSIPPVLITIALVCFALVQNTLAVSPAPDGGYPGGNTAEGTQALQSLTSGISNTGLGSQALFHNTTGSYNTANGALALFSNTTGNLNTATGQAALYANTTGTMNTANGFNALGANQTGNGNTADGFDALGSNGTGSQNTATGSYALPQNTTGGSNTATGYFALHQNADGDSNTATGVRALYSNESGNFNTANGFFALQYNTIGNSNTANGVNALQHNTRGTNNVALGVNAGQNLTTGSNNIDIANAGVAGESNTIRIGRVQTRAFIDGIRGAITGMPDAVPVVIDSAGQLGTASSSRRFKKEIKPMDKASEAILALKPVTFHYRTDKTNRPEFGLIAEEVAEVNPDLVVCDTNGEIYTVRYDAVNAMLLNEFLKEHRKVEELKKDFQATVAQLATRLDEQAAQIQKVSAQLEAGKPAPQMAENNY